MDPNFISEWFQYADSDLSSAEYLLDKRPKPFELICYLCEQSAEKNLKGYLIYKGMIEPPKIHDLDILCEMCSEYDERFIEMKRACNTLTRYGVQPRYPHEMEIQEHDMEKALEYARQIQSFNTLQAVRAELL